MHRCVSFISHLQMTLLIIPFIVLKKLFIIKNQNVSEVIGGIQRQTVFQRVGDRWSVDRKIGPEA